ncbi:MAG: glycosyltransferase, partial [Actinomycetota bacterium]|nr:glycosyltransferase [Actinomycetota bacterium]
MPAEPTATVAVVVPALGRPDHAAPFVASMSASCDRATAYFVCDPADEAERVAAADAGATVLLNPSPRTTFAVKVNHGYRSTIEPWILVVGDDVRFNPGWFDAALAAAGEQYHL